MKKVVFVLVLPLVVVSGLVFANRDINNATTKKSPLKPPTAAEKEAAMKQWRASPEGIQFCQWEASPAGIKVYASEAKISRSISDFTNMEAIVTSLSLPPGSRLGFGVMVRINGEDFILNFVPEAAQLKTLQSLNVNDKIIIRSHTVSHAPKYAYPILSGDYVERDGIVIFKRIPRKDGC